MAETKVNVHTPTLIGLCSSKSLRMPVFQRPYGWPPEKAVEYFRDFLTNTAANNLFGSVFGYSQRAWLRSPRDAGENELYVTDGQHRLVTSAVAAIALLAERESRLAVAETLDSISPDMAYALEQLRNSAELNDLLKIAATNLEFMVNSDGRTASVHDFLVQTDGALAQLHAQIESTRRPLSEAKARVISRRRSPIYFRLLQKHAAQGLTPEESVDFEKHAALAKRIQDERDILDVLSRQTSAEIARLETEVRALSDIPLYAAYVGLKTFLHAAPTAQLSTLLTNFSRRQKSFAVALLILEPSISEVDDIAVMDDEAAEIFAQINGQTKPLTPGELLNSLFRSFKGFHDDKPSEVVDHLNNSELFALDGERIVDYLARYVTTNGNTKTSQWVRQLLANVRAVGGATATQARQTVIAGLQALEGFEKHLLDSANTTMAAYAHLYKAHARAPFVSSLWVMVARIWESAQKSDHPLAKNTVVQDLYRVILLLRLASINNRSTVNLTRDLANKKSLEEVFIYIANGLGYGRDKPSITPEMVEHVRREIREVLVTGEFGLSQNRNFARVLLATADFEASSLRVSFQQLFQYQFEHVLPQSLKTLQLNLEAEDDTSDVRQAQSSIVAMLELPETERASLINRLGNGALLEQAANISLGNISPYEKLLAIDAKGLHNGYWPSHLQALRDLRGIIGKEQIVSRTEALSDQILEFLFNMSFLREVTALAA